jgi:hypothetical protein
VLCFATCSVLLLLLLCFALFWALLLLALCSRFIYAGSDVTVVVCLLPLRGIAAPAPLSALMLCRAV